jgi:hypothetical protein
MTHKQKNQLKQQKAVNTEADFENFCQKNDIIHIKMDRLENTEPRRMLLKNKDGKCPDFWCKKDGKEIFVEMKTLTNLTNEKREKMIEKATEKIVTEKRPFGMVSGVFDPIPEMQGPFTTMLKDASKKFKNLKDELETPRILFLHGIFFNARFTIHAIFLGAHDSYRKENGKLVYAGLTKGKTGLFDKTGSNVSAIVYWNKESDCFCALENPKAKLHFSEDIFETFFNKAKI